MSFSSAARRGSSDALSAGAAGRGAGVPVSEALSAALARDEVSSEVSSGEFKASVSCKVRLARRAPGACQAANSGACVRFELQLQQDDGVLDFEFALFQALQLEVVDAGLIRYSVDQTVEPTMLRLQLQNPVAKCVRVDDVMLIAHARLRSTVTRAACSRCSARCLRLLSGSKRVTATVCTTARAGYCVHYCDITTAWHPPCGWVRYQHHASAIQRHTHVTRTAHGAARYCCCCCCFCCSSSCFCCLNCSWRFCSAFSAACFWRASTSARCCAASACFFSKLCCFSTRSCAFCAPCLRASSSLRWKSPCFWS